MPAPKFTAALAKEYGDLFNRCEIAGDKMAEVERVVQRILHFQDRYESIAAQSTVCRCLSSTKEAFTRRAYPQRSEEIP